MESGEAEVEGGEVARSLVLSAGEDSVEVLEISEDAGGGQTLGDVTNTQEERRDRPARGDHVGEEGDRQQD